MESFRQLMDEVVSASQLGVSVGRRIFLAGAARAATVLGMTGALGALGALTRDDATKSPQKEYAGGTAEAAAAIVSQATCDEFDFIPRFNPQAKYKGVFGHDSGPRGNNDVWGQYFQGRIHTMTKGEFSINIIGGGVLGGGDAIAKSVRAGSVEICNASGAILGGVLSPEFPLFDLPYLIKSYGHLMRVALSSPYIKKMHEIGLTKGVQVLTPFNGGLRHIFYRSTKPILKPEDLKGVKLRTMNAPLDVEMWNAAGAQATPLSYAEVYNALSQGVVDGIDNTFDAATSIKVDEVVKSVTKTAHRYQLNYVIVNDRWFQSLPKTYQEYLVQGVEEAGIYATGYVMMNDEVRQPVAWAKKGIAIYEPDRKAFENNMMKVYSKFGPQVGGQESIDAILKLQ